MTHRGKKLASPPPCPAQHVSGSTLSRTGPRLVIVCGLPGSGKTYHAKQVEHKWGAVRFCADEWMDALGINLWDSKARQRVENLQWSLARKILSLDRSVVIEWGTWTRSERDALRTEARALGAGVELHFLDAPVQVLYDRICRRKMETPAITFEDVQKWAQLFERPQRRRWRSLTRRP